MKIVNLKLSLLCVLILLILSASWKYKLTYCVFIFLKIILVNDVCAAKHHGARKTRKHAGIVAVAIV